MLDRSSPLPLWAQIVADLRNRLAAGEFDTHFPTDEELTRYYDVSRHTAREAVRRLQADGLLLRERGRGTMLIRPELEQPLQGMYSLAATVRSKGLEERSEVLACKLSTAEEVAMQLGVAKDEQVVYIERLRFAGDEPLALDRSWLPADLARGLLDADLSSGSLYDSLVQYCNLRVTNGWERIRPLNPSVHDREILRLPPTEAVFAIERLTWAGDRPLEWRISFIRGDRYCFRATWTGPVGNLVSSASQLL